MTEKCFSLKQVFICNVTRNARCGGWSLNELYFFETEQTGLWVLYLFHGSIGLLCVGNKLSGFMMISLRIRALSGAIDPTSRKGVGPGLWQSHKDESLRWPPYRSPMFNLGEISMKKTLIALAVLAASGAAMAQSSVTLYGVADIWLGSSKVTVNGAGERQTVINTSGVNGSRFGLKGTEDLGGGMKAIFQLENGYNLDTGAQKTAGSIFDRQAYVGLDTGFGTVTLGRQYSPYDDFNGTVAPNYYAFTFYATGLVAQNGMADYSSRNNNSVKFQSANYSGFSAAALYAFGENKNSLTNVNGDATDTAGLNIQYANGPLVVGYAYQQDKLAKVVGFGQDKNKYNLIGGSYDFGVVKLTGSYNQAKNDTTKDKEYQVGLVVPLGAASITAGYARSKSDAGAISNTGSGYAVLATYDLSKRTRLYAGAVEAKAHVNNAPAETKTTTYGLGVRHSF